MWGSSLWAEAEISRAMSPAAHFPAWRRTNTLTCSHGQRQQDEYLMGIYPVAEKMPRKLKVAFSSSPSNLSHATYRDLGFAARPDGYFDVYSAGGLGNNPQFGVKVAEGVAPEKILYYIKAMWLTFRAMAITKTAEKRVPGICRSARRSGKLPEGVSGEASGGTGIRGAAGSFPRGSDGSGRNKRKAEKNQAMEAARRENVCWSRNSRDFIRLSGIRLADSRARRRWQPWEN